MNAPPVKAAPLAVDINGAAHLLAVSVSTVEKLVRIGSLPRPRKIPGIRRVVYLVEELNEWLRAQEVSDLLPPPNTGAPKPRRRA